MQWTIIRLVVSENDWRRHNSEMEPKRRGKPSPLCTWRRSKTLGLRKATLRSRIHVQEVGLNAGGKGPASSRRGGFSLDIPLYRTFPVTVNRELAVGALLFVLILRRLTGILRCFLRRGLDGRADIGTGREEHHPSAPFFRKVVRIAFNAESNPFHRSFAWNISQSAVHLQNSVSRSPLQGRKADAQYSKTASRHRS